VHGIKVEKLEASTMAKKEPQKVSRILKIDITPEAASLMWAVEGKAFTKCLDVRDIIFLGYGFSSRGPWIFRDVDKDDLLRQQRVVAKKAGEEITASSWVLPTAVTEANKELKRRKEMGRLVDATRCFSVYLAQRSYDFICASADDAESFMLTLTRLCTAAQGWPIHGGIKSHANFLATKGWVKVQRAVMEKVEQAPAHGPVPSLPSHIKDSVNKAASQSHKQVAGHKQVFGRANARTSLNRVEDDAGVPSPKSKPPTPTSSRSPKGGTGSTISGWLPRWSSPAQEEVPASDSDAERIVRAVVPPQGGWETVDPGWRNLSWMRRWAVVQKYQEEQAQKR
jgi:hypothetical protein